MGDFPKNLHEMIRMSYRKTGDATCKGCGAQIEWWKTTNGHNIPMNPMPMQGADDHAPAVPHWATCPKAKDFKAASAQCKVSELEPVAQIAERTELPLAPAQAGSARAMTAMEFAVRDLRRKYDARVVVLVREDGQTAFFRDGIAGEDLRSDLIATANYVRDCVVKRGANHG
jgi:monoamine oxidase